MYSLETLRDLNAREVADYFEDKPLVRLRVPEDVRHAPDYSGGDMDGVADHFHVVKDEEFFVDSSGFGSPGEPAFTYPAFMLALQERMRSNPGRVYYAALCGVGQFQVYIQLFYKEVKRQ